MQRSKIPRTKPCSKCGGTDFNAYNCCKPCVAKDARAWRRANQEKAKTSVRNYQKKNPHVLILNQRKRNLRAYGLTLEQYDTMLKNQDGACAICKTETPNGPGGKYFVVDHDHATGRVRGLLCCRCNLMLGASKDSVATLTAGISYLEAQGCT